MKVKHIIISFLLILPLLSFGQNRLSFGMKAGVGLAGTYDKYKANETTYKNTFVMERDLGLWASLKLSKEIAFNVELGIQRSGRQYTHSSRNEEGQKYNQFRHIESFSYAIAPISFSYKISSKHIKPYVNLGIAPTYMLSGKEKVTYDLFEETPRPDYIQRITSDDYYIFGRFDIQGLLGLGLEIGDILSLEMRYMRGIHGVSHHRRDSPGFCLLMNPIANQTLSLTAKFNLQPILKHK